MNYFAAYWQQIKWFYIQMGRNLFSKERNTDMELTQFQPARGFLWDFIDMHKLFGMLIFRIILTAIQIIFGYVASIFLIVLMIVAPVLIIILFPLFAANRWRRLRKEAAKL